jgi:hypothetical protein
MGFTGGAISSMNLVTHIIKKITTGKRQFIVLRFVKLIWMPVVFYYFFGQKNHEVIKL